MRPLRSGLFLALALGLALGLAACGAGPATPAESFDASAPQLTAHDATFDKTELRVPANKGFEIVLFNRDPISHNVSIYSDASYGQRIFGGSLAGNGMTVYHVQALAPGTYYFECEVHPSMRGSIVAS